MIIYEHDTHCCLRHHAIGIDPPGPLQPRQWSGHILAVK